VAVPNPEFLLCDADALIQVFIARQGRLLVHLRDRYGVTPAVVPEVELEVSNHRKFGGRFEPALVAAMSRDQLVLLDGDQMRRSLSGPGPVTPQVEQRIQRILERSRRYRGHVGLGEAYSHAAAVELQLPLMSHDWQAVQLLQQLGEPVAAPVIRIWDLFALALDDGAVEVEDGERASQHLEHDREHVPPFLARPNPSFEDAIRTFNSRLRRAVAGGTPQNPQNPKDVLYLHPLP